MNLDQALSNVKNLDFGQETLQSVASLASTIEGASAFVTGLLNCQSSTDNCGNITFAMDTLEALAEHNEFAACVFMAHLWIAANNARMHDVCDGIDIWISRCMSNSLKRHLIMFSASHEDAGIRRHFDRLAK